MEDNQGLSFNIGSFSIPYSLVESKKTKYIKLVMDINGLRVIKPYRAKFNDVEKLLNQKSNWIYKHYINFKSVKIEANERQWETGESIWYLGDSYPLSILENKKKHTVVKFTGTNFEVFLNESYFNDDKKALIERGFEKWYIEAARNLFADKANYYCEIMGLKYNEIRIKEQKTRWGSCSKKGNLNFNWKLVMAPEWVVDYVLVHELCHLRHMNHSKEFWAMVKLYAPKYEIAQGWLKKNGFKLVL